MDRRTIRYPDGAVELKCSVNDAVMLLAEYEDTGREPEEIAELTKSLLVGMNKRNRAMELLQAESEGRLIVLPCKVGDTVWRAFPSGNIEESRISMLQQKADGSWKIRLSDRWGVHDESIDEIGKTVFHSREEAEAALGGDGDG